MTQGETERSLVCVIDDDPSIRASLEDLLASVGLEAQLFASAQQFLQSGRPDLPTCLVLDIRMPGMSGLDVQHELARLSDQVPIVFITAHGDVPTSVRAMKAGAIEFLMKPFRDQELLDAVQKGIERDRERRRDAAITGDLKQRLAALTRGEREVLALVVSGLLNKQIAGELGLSEITVKVRRGHIMRKMQAKSLVELVRIADKLGVRVEKDA